MASSATNPFVFNDNSNSSKILDGLNHLRLNNLLCDIVLRVENRKFNCHKVCQNRILRAERCWKHALVFFSNQSVLSSFSNYFKAMFTCELAESKQTQICFNDIDPMIMEAVVDYAYTSQLVIHENNVQALLQTSNLFDIKSVKDACCRYMEWHMEPVNEAA